MFKGRRVGTLTAGIVLIASGILFLLRLYYPFIDYSFILNLWPVVLILLGIEVLLAYILHREDRILYDGWSIVLMMLLSFFCVGMAVAQFVVEHMPEVTHYIH